MNTNINSPRHEKERGNNVSSQERMTDEQRDVNVENIVLPWMHSLMGKPSNSPQARSLKQQLDANTMMYEAYFHKNAAQLDPTGECATKQEVDALLARQEKKYKAGIESCRCETKHGSVITVAHGTVEPDQLSPFSKIRMRKGGVERWNNGVQRQSRIE
ncbi:MAG: hypothetical protein EZS28_011786 [Streblomastix strix]|uniref:Uncharacterized protein n=1 Tax=Streblomastix strix TaxID=222440 RepID=A0A5J4WCR7_9EUKA|nr:MAG: hypothetical protein EZS28_011786 [Streblomastix strix]